MVKILSQAGNSLADIYDVEGSIAGIDQLETRELPIFHEMGSTVFAERLRPRMARATTGAINQSIGFDLSISDLPENIWRILGVTVLANVVARTDFIQISIRDPELARELPIFVWDTANDIESTVRIVENGAAVGNQQMLVGRTQLPSIGLGPGQPVQVGGDRMLIRGQSTAFGAGTVTIVILVYIAFPEVPGVSSRGLTIPSW